jgi:metal-responsive CopG/Arc/MetJ family transcriptional regulator
MKRLQIMIEENLDAELEREARRDGTSKAAIIRELVRDHVEPLPPLEDDPITQMIGMASFEPAHHDDIVYPR